MAQVKNTGRTAMPYRGGYILPGHVKNVADEDIDALRKSGDILVLPAQGKTRRPSAPESPAVAEPIIPDPPPEISETDSPEEVKETEGEDKSERKKSKRRKKGKDGA